MNPSELALGVRVDDLRFARGPFTLTCSQWDLHPGLTILVGLNGAGKSTFLNLLVGRLRASDGVIDRQGVGPALPQSARVDWPGDVTSFLTYMGGLRGVHRSDRPGRVEAAVHAAGLLPVATDPVKSLSGGFHRRLTIAQCLLDAQGALLLDEPTDTLDVAAGRHIWQMLKAVSLNRAVLVATHHASAALEFADHLVSIDAGRVGRTVDGRELRDRAAASEMTADQFLLDFLSGPAT